MSSFNLTRRLFATTLGLGLALAVSGFATTGASAGTVKYSPAAFEKAKKSGKPVMLDFYAPWCSTCRTQSRVVDGLRAANKNYEKISFMRVDWDTNKTKPISRGLKIPRRSTLVMFKGGKEVGRVVAGTSKTALKALLDKGL